MQSGNLNVGPNKLNLCVRVINRNQLKWGKCCVYGSESKSLFWIQGAITKQTVSSLHDFKGSLRPVEAITAHLRDNLKSCHPRATGHEWGCVCLWKSASILGYLSPSPIHCKVRATFVYNWESVVTLHTTFMTSSTPASHANWNKLQTTATSWLFQLVSLHIYAFEAWLLRSA